MSAIAINEHCSTRVRKILALRGPNIWARDTVLECWVEFLPVENPVPNWRGWLLSWVPSLESLLQSISVLDAESRARLLNHITLYLQSRSDLQLNFFRTVPTSHEGLLRIIIQYDEEEIGRSAFELARCMVEAAISGTNFDFNAEFTALKDRG